MVSVRDIIIIAVILLAIGIIITPIVYISKNINNRLILEPVIANNVDAVSVLNSSSNAIDKSDYMYLLLFISFFISVVITGWFSASHPIFTTIYFIVIILFVFISIILQNVWENISLRSIYLSAQLPITNFILSHLAYFMAIFSLVGILLMFAKGTSEGVRFG